jgi:hypothetical protein
MPGTSISASETEKSSSFIPTEMPLGRDLSRFFNSFASLFIMLGGKSSYVALNYSKIENSKTREVVIHEQKAIHEQNQLSCFMNELR